MADTEHQLERGVETPDQGGARQSSYSCTRSVRRTPWRSRQYTPYSKTPISRHLREQVKTPPADSNLPHLLELVGKTWRMYKMSPLYNFSYKESLMRNYGKQLAAFIETEIKKGEAVGIDDERVDSAVVSVFQGLKIKDSDPRAVEIIFKQKSKNGAGDVRVVLSAVLCCVGISEDILANLHKSFTFLPLLLVKGPITLTRHLCTWIEVTFDSHVSPLIFSPIELSWMVAMWAGYLADRSRNKSIELNYSIPAKVKELSRIVLDIDPVDCKHLWESIHDSSKDIFHEDEVVAFIKSLEAHFYKYFRIKLEAMPLTRIGTAIAYIGDGKLKVFLPAHVPQVLSHLTEFAMEMYFSA